MRKLIMALAGVSALAFAAPAFATSDAYQVQLNLNTAQGAASNTAYVNVGGKLAIDTSAVGNNLSVTSSTVGAGHSSAYGHTNNDARIASLQVNANTSQSAITNLNAVNASGNTAISTQAIGNSVSATSEHGWVTSGYINPLGDKAINLQANVNASQGAATNIVGSGFGSKLDVATVAVGSNVSADGAIGVELFNGQLNYSASQSAVTNVSYSNAWGSKSAFNTQAFGNVASATGNTADVQSIQANLNTAQFAGTNIGNSAFAGNLSISTTAVGNSLTVKTN
jgi:hypothetical protein